MAHIIRLWIEEDSEVMAYQFLACAIKKKYKKKIRPAFGPRSNPNDDYVFQNHQTQNDRWLEISGQSYDY